MSLLDGFPHRCKIQRRKSTKDSSVGGLKTSVHIEREDMECWEQQASDREVTEYQKRGMHVTRKVYFLEDPGLTERHQIVITERDGEAVPVASQIPLDVKSKPKPDASAGMGVVWKVMVDEFTGAFQ